MQQMLLSYGQNLIDPSTLPGRVLDLDSDLGITLVGSDVDVWANQVGGGPNAFAPTAVVRPEYKTNVLNGHNSVFFNATVEYLSFTSDFFDFPDYSLIAVAKPEIVDTWGEIFSTAHGVGNARLEYYFRTRLSSSYVWRGLATDEEVDVINHNIILSNPESPSIVVSSKSGQSITNRYHSSVQDSGFLTQTNALFNASQIWTTGGGPFIGVKYDNAGSSTRYGGDLFRLLIFDQSLDNNTLSGVLNFLKDRYTI